MDSMELEETAGVATHDTGRRDFLKRSAAVGALAWSAPAITSLAAGRAWAQTYPCDCRSASTGLIVRVPDLGTNMVIDNGVVDPCMNEFHSGLLTVALGQTLQVDATTVCADDTRDATAGTCQGTASIQTLDINGTLLGELAPIRATALTTVGNASCNPTSAETTLASLSVAGNAVPIPNPCNFDVLLSLGLGALGQLVIGRQVCGANNTLTAQAMYVNLLGGVAEIIAAQSILSGGGACTACTP